MWSVPWTPETRERSGLLTRWLRSATLRYGKKSENAGGTAMIAEQDSQTGVGLPRPAAAPSVSRECRVVRPDEGGDLSGQIGQESILERRGTEIAVVLGVGVRVGVRNGYLHVTDRLGRHRRERSWAPGGRDLGRIVVG